MQMDRLLVVDLEATCWADPNVQRRNNQEVIEIGLVNLSLQHSRWRREGEVAIFVKPTTSEVSGFCADLTGIKSGDVANAISFTEVCEVLRKEYKTANCPWASWGDFDRLAFERQCTREDVRYPWGRTHYNLKAMWALARGKVHQCGVADALRQAEMEFVGSPHRALDDATNTARLAEIMIGALRTGMEMTR